MAAAVGWAVPRALRSGPPQVAAAVLPVPHGTTRAAVYLDCSPQLSVAYLANFPCWTYVLMRVAPGLSQPAALGTEERLLAARGWRQTRWGWRDPHDTACASVSVVRSSEVVDVTGRGGMTRAKARFIRSLTSAEDSDSTLFAMLYPASGERC